MFVFSSFHVTIVEQDTTLTRLLFKRLRDRDTRKIHVWVAPVMKQKTRTSCVVGPMFFAPVRRTFVHTQNHGATVGRR